jgi:hypothetical protein
MRLAVLSNTELHPAVNWTTLGPPLLEPLAAYPGAHLIAPPPFRWDRRSDWLAAVRRYLRSDTVFWMQSSSRPELPLWALSAIKPTIRRSAFVVDAWRPALTKIGVLAVTQRLTRISKQRIGTWFRRTGSGGAVPSTRGSRSGAGRRCA